MNKIFQHLIFLSILFCIISEEQSLISIEINKLNNEIKNEIFSKEHFKIIGISIDDTETNGLEIQFDISTTWDSPVPFTTSIKYIELTKGFTDISQYLFHLEMLYLIKLQLGSNGKYIFSFSCSNQNNTNICGFYLNENLINFEENFFLNDNLNLKNGFGYVLQNNTNTIVHYMNYDSIPYLIFFLDINNEEDKAIVLKFNDFQAIKCILFNNLNFLCLFVNQIDELNKSINIKHYNTSKLNFIDEINENFPDYNNNTNDDEAFNPYLINETLSFNLNLINSYSFDFYKTEDNNFISCFLINEGNFQKIICYKNTFDEINNSPLTSFPIYKSCEIKKDNKPDFFDYEKISIIYANTDTLKIILYTFNKSKYLIIDLNTLSSFISKENENFLLEKISNQKKKIYLLNDIEITNINSNSIQCLNLIIKNDDTFLSTTFNFPIKPSIVEGNFLWEEKLGEVVLTEAENSFFTLLDYTSNKHSIQLNQTGIITGTYKYSDIPSHLLFKYQLIIYPQYCLSYTSDAQKCIKCEEGTAYMPDNSLCYSENEIPDHYYLDTLMDYILKCDENCFKCSMLKTGGYSECIACNENYYIYRSKCFDKCPEDSFFYSYKKVIKALNYEESLTINACTDTCEEGYTGHIFQEKVNETINKLCIFDKYKKINEDIELRFEEFLLLDKEGKEAKIPEQKYKIKNFTSLDSSTDFNLFSIEFLLINDFINNLYTISKIKNVGILQELCRYYFNLSEEYFSSIGGVRELLNNTDDNIIYFYSTLSSLFNNAELLEKTYYDKIMNYFFQFEENLNDISVNSNETNKINSIINSFLKFMNETIDSCTNYIDPHFDPKKFKSDIYYRYLHNILLGENNIRMMNITNNLFQFLQKFDQNLYYYQNSFASFYIQKISEEEEDKEFNLTQLGLNLIILGSNSKITTSSFSTYMFSQLMEKGELCDLKIILPPLKILNNQIDWEGASIGLIIYNGKYPLLNKNATEEVSPNFISINFYDKNKNVIQISNINENNLIKIIKKKAKNDLYMDNCVYYDESIQNLNDIGCNSYDFIDYMICTTNHLSDFTIASFSPSYLMEHYKNVEESSEKEKIKNSHWIKDRNILSNLNGSNAIIIYINLAIILLCLILIIVKFFTKQENSKTDRIIEDPYLRYTINEDVETDKKILKYILEKEIDYILKNRSDYENQKKQEMALDAQNDIFTGDQKIITIIEDESDDDDDEEINEKKIKKVSFRNTVIDNSKKADKKKVYKKETHFNLKKLKNLKTKGKNPIKEEINIELPNIKEENDFIEIDETQEDVKTQSNKYNYNFSNKSISQKNNSTVPPHHRNSTFSNLENMIEDNINKNNIKKNKIKKQSMHQRFKKNVKEQKNRLIYSILDKTLNDIKNTGQNSFEASPNVIKRPSSLIGISNALSKVGNKEEEKLLIKNEFFVIFKLMLYILYQYEYRPISLFNEIILPITRNNLICLLGFRLSLQLSICIIISPRYFRDNYSFSSNLLSIFLTIIFADVIYTIIELILMKKKISTSTDIKSKGIIKFKQILICLLGYIILLIFFLFGFYNSLWVSLFLEENNIKCHYINNFIAIIFVDYIIYESIILAIKSLIFTYIVYQDSEGFILKVLEIFSKIFIFYLAE